ncbi:MULTISPECIES: N-formylglutamate amidohydrolase [Alphaproteobacteria]|uniref:N-formylglutamate amidohydrolase n=1 Tax=Alphaproteobacteria TaxID=28211 RepID=UPI003267282B
MTAILTDRDACAFGERNPEGRGTILFISDHHRNRIPASLNNLGLSETELAQHIGYDIGVAWIAEYLSDRFDSPLVHANYSRLLIDCNRVPGTEGSIPEIADGTPVPGNLGLSEADREHRRIAFFEPYHNAVRRRMKAMEAEGRAPITVALHSFTPMMQHNGIPRPWEIGFIWNQDGRLALPLIEALRTDPALTIGDNEPYSGRDGGYSLNQHPEAAGHPHVGVEFRQDLVATREDAHKLARVFGNALEFVVSSLTL